MKYNPAKGKKNLKKELDDLGFVYTDIEDSIGRKCFEIEHKKNTHIHNNKPCQIGQLINELVKKHGFCYYINSKRYTLLQLTEEEYYLSKREPIEYKEITIISPLGFELTPEMLGNGSFSSNPNSWLVPVLKSEFLSLEKAKEAIDEIIEQYRKENEDCPMSFGEWLQIMWENSF